MLKLDTMPARGLILAEITPRRDELGDVVNMLPVVVDRQPIASGDGGVLDFFIGRRASLIKYILLR